MKKILLLFVLAVSYAAAQNTPAPCDPANVQITDYKYGCYNTPDCVTGFMCFFMRVWYDTFYGTTCNEEGMYFCSYPNGIAQKETNHAKVLLARIRNSRTIKRG